MKSFFAAALVASLTVAQDCSQYDFTVDAWTVYDDCFANDNLDTCQYICSYGSCDSWWLDSEITDACAAVECGDEISCLPAW